MKLDREDIDVLLYFLKSGLSARKIDEKLDYDSKKSKGWISWKILKKYNIQKEDRNKLFCFRKQQSITIIKEIFIAQDREEVVLILGRANPKFFEKYKDIYIVAGSISKVVVILSGEVRNITQSYFSPLKKIVATCQFLECENGNLDTVHLKRSRPENLKLACEHGHLLGTKKYDVYKILLHYIQLHSEKKSICFMCKEHHVELSKHEKTKGKELVKFRKQIISNL